MTFTQLDINLNRFKYTIEDTGLRVSYRKGFSITRLCIPFENIGSKIIKVEERKTGWLAVSILFMLLAFYVFYRRLIGIKIGDGAEVFYLCVSAVFFGIYAWKRENSLWLVHNDANEIEFSGTWIFRRRLDKFIKELHTRRDDYLKTNYPAVEDLTLHETVACINANLTSKDGVFLKQSASRSLTGFVFGKQNPESKKRDGIRCGAGRKKALKIVQEHQSKLIAEGRFLYVDDSDYDQCYICLTPRTTDPYEIMKLTGTNGSNFNITTDDIIAKYRAWDKAFGIRVLAIGDDSCECEIINKDIDYIKLAADVYEFCPDVVDQGTETVEKLEKDMKETGRIFLWWD